MVMPELRRGQAIQAAAIGIGSSARQDPGPIKRKEAQLLPVCEAMFREVEGKASCTGSGMNSTDASASAPGSLPAPAAAASASSSP
jgi:hypothetical protein